PTSFSRDWSSDVCSSDLVATFSVAENHRRRVGDDWQDDGTTWWRITVWGQHAETLADTLDKGERVLVIGTVRSREWEKDGEQRTSYDVTARHVAVIPRSEEHTSELQSRENLVCRLL